MKAQDRLTRFGINSRLARPAEVAVAVVCVLLALFPFETGGAFGRFGHFLSGAFGPATQVWALWLLLCRVFRFQISASAAILLTAIWTTYLEIVLRPESSILGRSAGGILLALLGNAAMLVGALGVLVLARWMAVGSRLHVPSERIRPREDGAEGELTETQQDCLSALQNLGFAKKEAAQAVEHEREAAGDLDEMMRRCFQRLGGQPPTGCQAAVPSSLG